MAPHCTKKFHHIWRAASRHAGRNDRTLNPCRSSARAVSRTAFRVAAVTGISPSSSNHPIGMAFASSIEIGRRSTGGLTGSRGSCADSVRNRRITSAMVRPIGSIAPSIENGPMGGLCPRPGTRPGVGFSEQMPQKCAGSRTDPPLSLPSPPADSPAAIAAASPPLDPPEERFGSHGFLVLP